MSKVHIVCLRFSSLGDVLLQTSFFSQLKKEFGDKCKLTLMTAEEFEPVLRGHPHIDHILSFSRKSSLNEFLQTFGDYHDENPVDFIIDLHNTTRANLLKLRFWNIPKIAVDKRKIERKLLTSTVKVNLLKNESIMKRVIKDFNFLFKEKFKKSKLTDFLWANPDSQSISSIPDSFDKSEVETTKQKFKLQSSYVAIIPSASHQTKRWPVERFLDLAKQLAVHSQVIVLAGPEDDFCNLFNGHENIVNLQGQTSYLESSRLVGAASLCIGNDTGLIHIAEAQNIPCLMIMGPTSEFFGFSTHLEDSHTFSHKLWCRPCSATGSKKCFRKKQYCLEMTSVSDVYEKAKSRLVL